MKKSAALQQSLISQCEGLIPDCKKRAPLPTLTRRNSGFVGRAKNQLALTPNPGGTMQLAPSPVRPVRPPVPALPPIESLQATHRELLLALDQLTRLLRDVDERGLAPDLRAIARSVTRFIDETGRQHHAEEERYVFPDLMESADVDLVQHVRRLQQDHGWLEEDWLELGPQLDALAHGIGGYDLASLQRSAEVFSQLYRDHIALEETIVYPEARRLGLAHASAGLHR
jgi:hemerythrin-like domain-containing protein